MYVLCFLSLWSSCMISVIILDCSLIAHDLLITLVLYFLLLVKPTAADDDDMRELEMWAS